MDSGLCDDCQHIDLAALEKGYCHGPTFGDLYSRSKTCRFCSMLHEVFEHERLLETILQDKVFIQAVDHNLCNTSVNPHAPWTLLAITIKEVGRKKLGFDSDSWNKLSKIGIAKFLRLFAADGRYPGPVRNHYSQRLRLFPERAFVH